MNDDLQDLRETLTTAKTELADAQKRAEAAEFAVTVADGKLTDEPSDANAAKLKEARDEHERARDIVKARERRVAEREEALNAATRDADRAELERLQIALRDRAKAYAPIFQLLAEIERSLEADVVRPLEKLNQEHVRQWEMASNIARRLGDYSFAVRCQRPKNDEARTLARVIIAQAHDAEGRPRSVTHTWLDPFQRPAWNDDKLKIVWDWATGQLAAVKGAA